MKTNLPKKHLNKIERYIIELVKQEMYKKQIHKIKFTNIRG